MTHLLVTHCLENEKARVCIGRKSMPDLRDTLITKILEHIFEDLIEGVHYEYNITKGSFLFDNGSEIISRSWSDKKYKKFRSLELSAAGVEELTENNDEDKAAYDELKMRVGRLSHVNEKFIISATNPDSPSHWAYKYFIESSSPTKHVYYSVTTDNKFLPKFYVEQLLKDLDPKMARRMIYGEWIEIQGEVVYYNYSRDVNFKKEAYKINQNYPIRMAWDFNVAENKPMSVVFFQFIDGVFHFFAESVIHSARTETTLEDCEGRGLFDHGNLYIIHGDATGRSRSPAAKHTNYDIILQYLSNYKTPGGNRVDFEIKVPTTNPPIRKRHNLVNAQFKNSLGQVSLYVYDGCKTLDEGFRLTKLKRGGEYVEDDSKSFQHVTTAAGYGICSTLYEGSTKKQGTVEL